MPELFTYNFMVNALIASFLASIAAGVIGSYVVVKRIVFISGGISHSTYGGIGLGYLLGFNPILGAVGAALVTAGIVAKISRKKKQSEDMLIGIVWALGMALGIFFINLSEGYAPDLMSYLFGNILLVSNVDLILMFILNIIVIGTVII
ncbi:MAG TPA: metal ABC transporter permease, partial [Ignavibacteria bacterium]|nr:metal ABC transporter permease [Ignavibacteria bacterium]